MSVGLVEGKGFKGYSAMAAEPIYQGEVETSKWLGELALSRGDVDMGEEEDLLPSITPKHYLSQRFTMELNIEDSTKHGLINRNPIHYVILPSIGLDSPNMPSERWNGMETQL